MIDIKLIREDAQEIKRRYALREKDLAQEIDEILELDEKRRKAIFENEQLKAEQNRVSKLIPQMKKEGKDAAETLAQMKKISEQIKENDKALSETENRFHSLMLALPNLPDPDLIGGGKENNKELRVFGEMPKFDFTPKNHVDLCTDLGLIDYERASKLAGNGYWIYSGVGARLEWALLNYFIDTHIADGYQFMLVPHMLLYRDGLTAGQFPKFTDEVYWIESEDGERKSFMLPTAETALVNLHRDEMLKQSDLPKKYIAYTPCYRKEAGSYRADERGMVRGHQFNKIEMVQYTTPDTSDEAFAELVRKAEKLLEGLGLHFRTVKLAAGDCSDSMARTYDIEVYIPSMGGYKEASSVSNARDYQARRGNMRYKRDDNGKAEFVHTLNGSGMATSRLLPAIVEQFQQADGSVIIPEVLRKYMGGMEIIK